MAKYKVRIRRSIIQDVELVIEASGRIKAADIAIGKAKSGDLDWETTETVDEQPYSVSEEKIK